LYLGLFQAQNVYGCSVGDIETYIAAAGLTLVLCGARYFFATTTYSKLYEMAFV